MAAHGMAENARRARTSGQVGCHNLRQFAHDVAFHPIVLRPRRLRRVQIKPRRIAKIPVIGVSRYARLARTRVRRDQHESEVSGVFLRVGLDAKGFFRASQARQEIQHRNLVRLRLRGQVSGKFHGAAGFARLMPIKALHAAIAGVLGNQGQVAHENSTTLRIDSPECIRSNALLMSFKGILWVMRSSMLILPSMYQSTIFGTSVRPRAPPKAVPFHTRPVTNWNGRVEISLPAPATPMITATPQPRWQHSSAWRMRSTLPTHSKL